MGDSNYKSPADHAADLLKKRPAQTPAVTWVIPLSLIVLAIVFLVFMNQGPSIRNAGTSQPRAQVFSKHLLVLLEDSTYFLSVHPGLGNRDDLFRCTASLECVNLTQTPALTETWPVLDADGERVAYYGLGDNQQADLFVLTLPATTTLPVTLRAGDSGLHTDYHVIPILAPAFSPNGLWLAFPAQASKGETVELFVARTDGQQVLRVTGLGQQLQDYIWLNNDTLIIRILKADGTTALWQAHWQGSDFDLQIKP